ncbi:CU044_2847 family protein [Streptomyces nanhaiensis]|uniref:CU044_2847 family protein n=1 Tax=Streptomyces nanhaiensis TaxID=679319 RepID=UPI00399C5EA9
MRDLARIPLENGGTVLFEAPPEPGAAGAGGPVKAGRIADTVREMPRTLQQTLAPVADTARAVLDQLRQAGPDEVEVEFGVDLSAQAGAVITKGGSSVHLKVRVLWNGGERGEGSTGRDGGTE